MVYISSHNIISSLGFTTQENISNIKNFVTGVKLHTDKVFSVEDTYFSVVNTSELNNKFSEFANPEAYTTFEKLLILSIKTALRNSDINVEHKDTLIIISTTKGNIDFFDNDKKDEYHKLKLYDTAKVLQDYFNTTNAPVIVSNACISGTLALAVAKRLIDDKKYKNIIVSGADIMTEFILSGFLSFKAVSSSVCKPFDINRDGINLGEGAGTVILTSEEKFASKPHIFIAGTSTTNDANHISGPSRTGEELASAIKNSLNESKISSSDIDYVSAHGTATPYNDEMESKAFDLADISNAFVTSIKGFVGHTLGAAGIIETIIGISAIENSEIYPTYGFSEKGVAANINVNNKFMKAEINSVVKTASGFGGCNAALVLTNKFNNQAENFQNIDLKISDSIIIRDNYYYISENKNFVSDENLSFGKFIKTIYSNSEINYPKFYKMDNLSKLAFVAADILLKDKKIIQTYKPEEISVILSNGSSSLDTDAKYNESISDRDNYFPSPAVFVYTLANVMIGEICIKHKIKGENSVYISEKFDVQFIKNYVEILFKTGKTKLVITGRVDFDFPSGNFEAVLFLIENFTAESLSFNIENINKIYNLN